MSATTRWSGVRAPIRDGLYVEQSQHRLDKLLRQIQVAHVARARHRRVGVGLDDSPQILDAFGTTEQVGHLAHHLEAAVFFGIMRGSDHHARQLLFGAGEVELIGTDHANVDHIGTLIHNAMRHRIEDLRARQPHVAPDQHLIGGQEGHERPPDRIGGRFVQISWVDTTNVIRLEDAWVNLHC